MCIHRLPDPPIARQHQTAGLTHRPFFLALCLHRRLARTASDRIDIIDGLSGQPYTDLSEAGDPLRPVDRRLPLVLRFMDPLHFCIAVAPLAVYLLMLGYLNLRRRSFVTTGARDAAALGIGVMGFIVAGPMELFFPEGAASRFGAWVWLLLIIFYGLCVSLIVLLMRPRLVIYNISMEELRPILTKVALQLDSRSRWIGDSLLLPTLNVHLHAEPIEWLRNVQLSSGGNQQSFEGWKSLEVELEKALLLLTVRPNLIGIPMLILSAGFAISAAAWMLGDKPAVAAALENLLRK